jgi:hypothetical protein
VSLNRRNVTLHLSLNQLFPADTESPSKGFRLRRKSIVALGCCAAGRDSRCFLARLERLSFPRQVSVVTFYVHTECLALVRPLLELLARIAMMKRSTSGDQADGLTCDDIFRCTDLCDFCNALEFF